ncbi:hypothetical protein MIND_01412500 [Mycena indigotica]|uniref:UbiA prenyltransferase n=1 Tax=Mycena indigotica TaxID=2126181 RepID=A0A8H6VPK5_9AGAR|nr:uncharacterized protein MIND_01412500 [Mycena indigotica]KAF7288959.1 hypothetical protein MIND_01412500 [Mycena indigotica]
MSLAQIDNRPETKRRVDPALQFYLEQEGQTILGFSFLWDAIVHELVVIFGCTWRDFSTTIIPGTLYTAGALRALEATPPPATVVVSLARSMTYFIVFVYSFTLANQITGVPEDQINKPDCPIVSGRISLPGAYVRWYTATAAFLLLASRWGVLRWAATWVGCTIFVTWLHGDKHWLTKNVVFLTVGTITILGAAWEFGAALTPAVRRFNVLLSVMVGIVGNIQDMRDVVGDKMIRRRTLPILLGPKKFPWVMAGVTAASPLLCWKLRLIYSTHPLAWYYGLLLTAALFYCAYRVLVGDSKGYHHQTYMVSTYIFCGCAAIPVLLP